MRGVRRAMARRSAGEFDDYAELLAGSSAALDELISELTVTESYFLREPAHFELIRHELVPWFVRERPASLLRCWSAGCATGEELYSLAIVLEEEGLGDSAQLFGTDICLPALLKAQRGQYSAWSFRSVSETFRERYFCEHENRFEIASRLRRRASFAGLNLADDHYPSAGTGTVFIDLILCRNVLIYLDETTVRRVAAKLFDALSPGGWLITGAIDPLLSEYAPFDMYTTEAGAIYRRPARLQRRSSLPPAPSHRSESVPPKGSSMTTGVRSCASRFVSLSPASCARGEGAMMNHVNAGQ